MSNQSRAQAIEEFQRARRQAAMQEIMARFTGKSVDLMSFDEVRQRFKLGARASKGLEDIPLDAIVGSVGRYQDFTRSFLPRQDRDQHRWAGVMEAQTELGGLAPIEVYQVGDVYFVLDGNHRVSVARNLGAPTIQAYVSEFKTKVSLRPDDDLDDLIIKSEYADFLERTRIDVIRPEADLQVTVPGRYGELETQIEAQRFLMSQEQNREVSLNEAVGAWYDKVYAPIVKVIRERGILRDFPERTETDLYLWLFRHKRELEKSLGWQIDPEAAAADLVAKHGQTPDRVLARVEEKLVEAVLPDALEAGPAAGQWRRERLGIRVCDCLFDNILVPIAGTDSSWHALDQAITVAQHERGRINGLYVAPEAAQKETEAAKTIQAEFGRRCQEAGIPGQLSVEVGQIARKITELAQWVDLVVMNLAHPPGIRVPEKLSSGFRTVLHRCPRPVLAVPGPAASLERILLAYDGSPKAQEGLFVATYMAGQWQVPLVVLTVTKQDRDQEMLTEAQEHLERRHVSATYVATTGNVAETILNTAAEQACDLIIMGGYGTKPVLEVILGSVVAQVLRESRQPMLICR